MSVNDTAKEPNYYSTFLTSRLLIYNPRRPSTAPASVQSSSVDYNQLWGVKSLEALY